VVVLAFVKEDRGVANAGRDAAIEECLRI